MIHDGAQTKRGVLGHHEDFVFCFECKVLVAGVNIGGAGQFGVGD
jgi:hypothetical protein